MLSFFGPNYKHIGNHTVIKYVVDQIIHGYIPQILNEGASTVLERPAAQNAFEYNTYAEGANSDMAFLNSYTSPVQTAVTLTTITMPLPAPKFTA